MIHQLVHASKYATMPSSSPITTSSTPLVLLVIYFLLVLRHQISFSNAASTIKQGQTLEEGEILNSSTGVFQLTFYIQRYLAILPVFGNIRYEPVWIANRDTKVSSGVLSLDRDGVFKLNGDNDVSIVLYSPKPDQVARTRRNDSSITATMLDNGNFVLVERDWSTGNEQLWWQSFDHPTDTLLSGMRLSFNQTTGESKALTSWVSDTVPNSGAFTLGINPNNTRELLILQRGIIFWRSGVWDAKNKTNLPSKWMNQTDSPYKFNYRFFSSENNVENYFTFTGKSNSTILVWVLRSMGELQSFQFDMDSKGGGATFRETMVECGMRDGEITTEGCEKQEKVVCSRRSASEKFEMMRGRVDANYSTPLTLMGETNMNASRSDCMDKCMSNCSCVAYAMADSTDQIGCLFWSDGSRFIKDNELDDVFYVLPEAMGRKKEPARTDSTPPARTNTSSAPPKKSPAVTNTESIATKSKSRKKWWIFFPIIGPVILVFFLIVLRWKRIKRLAKFKEKLMGKGVGSRPSPQQVLTQLKTTTHSNEDSEQCPDFQLFSFDCILSATNNLSASNKLGEGGFGPVYKGKLLKGKEVAVKRLSRSSGQGLQEFKNEITLIAKLQHMNLVKLLGCCIHGEERMLIYEYMPNKSLDSLIFDPVGRQVLDWRKRLMIIEGIAQGLLYLHKYSRVKIIHRDLKTSNVLLDADMNPKISDFGTARIFKQNESKCTNRIIGTYGYMSPEYAMDGIFSVKSDVFSFGVILLEIISGRKNTSFNIQFDTHLNLIGYAWDLWQRNVVIEMMDSILANASCSPPDDNSVRRCIHVGLLCVQERAVDRPTMSEVVSMFANEAMTLPSPKQPAFLVGRNVVAQNTREESEICSHNDVTISTLSVR
ncbi:hypothetical protein Syun_003539 [Stephania yunnanensis]|uniref:Receptor-like serine/threonine-protein kinase n=1 Tax=Stephania yunnanensis TaxID=152371 RepID=A0AAP0PZX6_9MAGN